MSKKKLTVEKQSAYGAKLALTAGSLSSLYLLPIAAQGTVIMGSGSIGLNFNTSQGNDHIYWDVDSNGSNDFALMRGKGAGWTANNPVGGRRMFLTSNGLNGRGVVIKSVAGQPNSPYATVNGAANTQQPQRWLGAMATLQHSMMVGPTLANGLLWGWHQSTAGRPVYRTLLVKNTNNTAAVIGAGAPNRMQGFHAGDNLFGFRFMQDSNELYGWGILNLSLGGGGNGASATITEWAYESTPNAEIHVIPEPSVASLALIGLGAGGVRTWRARKNARAEAAPSA